MFKHTEIGVDLGKYEIKIVKVELNSEELNSIEHAKSYTVDCEMYSEEYFKLLRQSIKDFAKVIQSTRLSLNFSFPMSDSANIVFMSVPSVDTKDLEEGVKFEASQVLYEEDLSNYNTAWKIINEYEELNEYEVLFETLESNILKSISKFKSVNWKINRIMLQPILLERFSENNDAIIDFGYENTRVYFYKGGKLSGVEKVDTGAYEIEKEIEVYLEANSIETEEEGSELMDELYVVNDYVENEGLWEGLSRHIKPLISDMISDIKGSIRAFELQNGISIDNIYHTGELFNLQYLDMALQSELDVALEPLNLIARDLDEAKYDLAALAAISPELKDTMDFAQQTKANVDYNSMLIAAVSISLSVGLALGVMNYKADTVLSEQMETESAQIGMLNDLEGEMLTYSNEIQGNQAFIDKIDGLNNEKKWLSDILYVIPDISPLSVSVKEMKIVGGKVNLKGYSADYSSIGFFAEKLQKFGDVEILSINDYEPEANTKTYSVTSDKPDTISDKFLITKTFEVVLNHNGAIVKR